MKDHEIAEFVNRLTKIARDYCKAQSLRDAISREVVTTLKNKDTKS